MEYAPGQEVKPSAITMTATDDGHRLYQCLIILATYNHCQASDGAVKASYKAVVI